MISTKLLHARNNGPQGEDYLSENRDRSVREHGDKYSLVAPVMDMSETWRFEGCQTAVVHLEPVPSTSLPYSVHRLPIVKMSGDKSLR